MDNEIEAQSQKEESHRPGGTPFCREGREGWKMAPFERKKRNVTSSVVLWPWHYQHPVCTSCSCLLWETFCFKSFFWQMNRLGRDKECPLVITSFLVFFFYPFLFNCFLDFDWEQFVFFFLRFHPAIIPSYSPQNRRPNRMIPRTFILASVKNYTITLKKTPRVDWNFFCSFSSGTASPYPKIGSNLMMEIWLFQRLPRMIMDTTSVKSAMKWLRWFAQLYWLSWIHHLTHLKTWQSRQPNFRQMFVGSLVILEETKTPSTTLSGETRPFSLFPSSLLEIIFQISLVRVPVSVYNVKVDSVRTASQLRFLDFSRREWKWIEIIQKETVPSRWHWRRPTRRRVSGINLSSHHGSLFPRHHSHFGAHCWREMSQIRVWILQFAAMRGLVCRLAWLAPDSDPCLTLPDATLVETRNDN